jgi:aldehyde dehydrogenase (NAD+)
METQTIETAYLNKNEIVKLVDSQRKFFLSGQTRSVEMRLQQLQKLKKLIEKHEDDIAAALKEDLNKSQFEAYATETGVLLAELDEVIKKTPKWAKPRSVSTPLLHFPAKSYILPEPYGTVLNIAPWNYPFQLSISPAIGALSAGNTCVIKPSELAPATSALLAKIINNNFSSDILHVVEGGVAETQSLVECKWDYIFFTGGTAVGKIIYKAAAENLTPVTLELGGKSPCIVDKDVNMKIAPRRIAWGKYLNSGQTCIAPDYLYIHKDIKDQFVEALKNEIKTFFGESPLGNEEFGKIISKKHFDRVKGYLEGQDVIFGGKFDEANMKIEPTFVDNPSPDSPIMQDEIFGPLLPIIEFTDVNEVCQFINSRSKPLALYIFSNDKSFQKKILKNTSAGGVAINETIMHITNGKLPFGGVGDSGIGAYHGQHSFDTFSHHKAVLHRSNLIDVALRYPPYKKRSLKELKGMMKTFFN